MSAIVPDEFAGYRLDQVAAKLFDDFSRAVLTGWIRSGWLTVDDAIEKPRHRVHGGERLRLSTPVEAPPAERPAAQDVGLAVVFEDEDVIVVDKPAGLVVHPGAGNPDRTLVNGLMMMRPELAGLPRGGLVHRLDKDTSGLLVVAASHRAHRTLTAQLKDRSLTRRYIAFVEGLMVTGADIERPIGRHRFNRTRQAVRDDGRYAFTRVRVTARYRAHSRIRAELNTGRTHQIRVHLASIGHPLIGDTTYGARGRLPKQPSEALVEAVRGLKRQALHAAQLAFEHPATRGRVTFDAPLPADLLGLQAALTEDGTVE